MTVGVAVLALAASGVVIASAATPPPAHLGGTVGLRQVGPIDQANGYPMWYKDTSNTRLELCLDPSDPNSGYEPGRVQNWGHTPDRQSLPAFSHPGAACNGHIGFIATGGGEG